MRWFGVGLAIAGWLCSGVQWLSPALAQRNLCSVAASSAPSPLTASAFTSFGAMPRTMQTATDSSFRVVCKKKSTTGNLTLFIDTFNTYNGTPQLQVTSIESNSVFTGTFSQNGNRFDIPYVSSKDEHIGEVYYRISVAAPAGQVLRAATDYSVKVNAELN